jgi:hypothetical protein
MIRGRLGQFLNRAEKGNKRKEDAPGTFIKIHAYSCNQPVEKKMKKIIMTAMALIIVAASTEAMAQPKAVLGLGGAIVKCGVWRLDQAAT